MAKYRVETPDGKFEIDTPDDLTEDQVREVIRTKLTAEGKSYANAPNQFNAPEQAPTYEDPETALLSDVGTGIAELGKGVAQGGANVLDHAANWLQSGLNVFGGAGDALAGGRANNLSGYIPAAQEGYEGLRGIGRFAGEAAATAPLGALRGGALVQGAAGGALLSDAQDPLGVLMDAGMGAAAGRAGQAVFGGASRLANPQVSADQRLLLNEGVRLTPGSMTPRGSQVKRLEDIAATTPVVQGPVRAAQEQAVTDLNRAAVNRALRPIGQRVPANIEPGHDAIRYAGDQLSQAYGDVLPRLNGTLDRTFQNRVNTIRNRANLPAEYDNLLDQVQSELKNAFQRAGPNGAYSGRTLRDTSERLGDLAAGWRRSDDPYTRMVGDVADQYRAQLHALARRQNPQYAARLRDIDRGYASLVRVERGAANTADGVMTPAQYDAGVRGADRSTRRRQSARGRALDQDLSGAGRRVMQNTAAMGGSKDVNSLGMLAALGGAALFGKPAAIGALAGIGAGRAAYAPGAQDAIRAIMSRNPGMTAQAAAAFLERAAQAAPIAAPAAIESLRQ